MWTLTICTIILSFIIDGRCLKFGDSYESLGHTNLKSKKLENRELAALITPECIGRPGFERIVLEFLQKDKWGEKLLTWKIEGRPPYGLSLETVRLVMKHAFDVWSYPISNLKFREVSPYSNAHFVIKFVSGNHGDGVNFDGKGGTVGHAFFPQSGQIHFDYDESWTAPIKYLNSNERYYRERRRNSYSTNLLSVAVHEIGHALGLPHDNANRNSIMFPIYNSGHNEPKLAATDIKLLRYLYGPCETTTTDNRRGNRWTPNRRTATHRPTQKHRYYTERNFGPWGK